MATGEKAGQWGAITNTNLATILEQAIAGTTNVSITGSGGSITLTTVDGGTDQARQAILRVHGTYSGPVNIIAPPVSKIYLVTNESNQNIVIKTAVSTGCTVAAGEVNLVFYNATAADFQLGTVQIQGESTNIPNTFVERDGSGNFAAGTITATQVNATLVYRPKLQAYGEHVISANVTGTYNLDLNEANVFNLTLTGNTVFTFTNPPPVGTSKPCTVILKQDATGGRTATFTNAKYTDSQAPVLTTTPNRHDVLTFFTVDGGSSYFGTFAMANVT